MTDAQSTPLLNLYRRPGFLLRRAHQLSVAIFEEACQAVGLTPAQFGALTIVSQAEGLDQSALSRALGFDRVTTLHVVRGLTRRGLVAREPCDRDGRRFRLSLTEAGRELLAAAAAPAELAHQRLLSPLEAHEQAQLIGLLIKLCSALEPTARNAVISPPLTQAATAEGTPGIARKSSRRAGSVGG